MLADVWEEFKYQIQREESCLMEAYEKTISTLCQQLVKELPQHELDLLWLWSEGYYNWHEDEEPPAKEEDVVTEFYGRVCSRAGDEELIQDPDVPDESDE